MAGKDQPTRVSSQQQLVVQRGSGLMEDEGTDKTLEKSISVLSVVMIARCLRTDGRLPVLLTVSVVFAF